jgi:hypothetical protein
MRLNASVLPALGVLRRTAPSAVRRALGWTGDEA